MAAVVRNKSAYRKFFMRAMFCTKVRSTRRRGWQEDSEGGKRLVEMWETACEVQPAENENRQADAGGFAE
jgi:hypothetical protein